MVLKVIKMKPKHGFEKGIFFSCRLRNLKRKITLKSVGSVTYNNANWHKWCLRFPP
jgi:hypothetical protein